MCKVPKVERMAEGGCWKSCANSDCAMMLPKGEKCPNLLIGRIRNHENEDY